MSHRRKIQLSIICLILFVFVGFAIWLVLSWERFLIKPLSPKQTGTFIVTHDVHLPLLAHQLYKKKLLSHPSFFVLLAHWRGDARQIRMGEYAITNQMTPNQLLDNMVKGKGVMRKITLIEGTTMSQIRKTFLKSPALEQTMVNESDQQLMTALGYPGSSPEGLFFPDTYLYTWGSKDTKILHQAYQHMQDYLSQQWDQRAPNLPYKNSYEALIVASLVESETPVESERPLIAGVILQRLKKQMYLQIDPTVLYGVNKPFGSTITHEDLHSNNPYNTYRHYGLPPTPINMPSALSIQAALHPMLGDALYYVARGGGTHTFSATYDQHLEAVKKFRQLQMDKQSLWQMWLQRSSTNTLVETENTAQ